MLNALRQLLRPRQARPLPAIPPGQRVYAIGDIHGRADLLTALFDAIQADDASREAAETTIILLGDLVDRGPDSAGVVRLTRQWRGPQALRCIAGNHEEIFLASFDRLEVFRAFLKFGGDETLFSYGIDRNVFRSADFAEAQQMMRDAVPEEDLRFIGDFEERIVIGDYAFVHAGIMPGEPVDQQTTEALRWIREPFLSDDSDHGHVIVHGHTIVEEPDLRHNRIGIDTGAFHSGRLTALCLDGTEQWLLETRHDADTISVEARYVA